MKCSAIGLDGAKSTIGKQIIHYYEVLPPCDVNSLNAITADSVDGEFGDILILQLCSCSFLFTSPYMKCDSGAKTVDRGVEQRSGLRMWLSSSRQHNRLHNQGDASASSSLASSIGPIERITMT